MFQIEIDVNYDYNTTFQTALENNPHISVDYYVENGPGGGNPCYKISAPTYDQLLSFLITEYHDQTDQYLEFITQL